MTLPFVLPPVDTLLIAGRAVFLLFSFIVAALAFTAWRRAAQTQTQHVLAHTDLVLQRLADLETRVDATKLSVSELGDRVDRPRQAAAPASGGPGYQIAIRLARTGASREELMAGCGLSVSEAELVQRLHGPASVGHVTHS
jgi:alkylation response protein AidB-like acyl-CoA dehydrogenase